MGFLVAVTIAPLLAACSAATPTCDRAATLAKQAKLAQAAQAYAEAQRRNEGSCADDGLAATVKRQGEAWTLVYQGLAAQAAGDLAAARARYQSALDTDAENGRAAVGLRALTRRPATSTSNGSAAPSPADPPSGRSFTGWVVGVLLLLTLVAASVFAWRKAAGIDKRITELRSQVDNDHQSLEQSRKTSEETTPRITRLQDDAALLKAELTFQRERAGRLFNSLARVQSGAESETSQYFALPDLEQRLAAQGVPVRLIDLSVFWVARDHLRGTPDGQVPAEDHQGWIVIERVMLGIPPEDLQAYIGALSRFTSEGPSGLEGLVEAFDTLQTSRLYDSAWEKRRELWVIRVSSDLAPLADGFGDAKDQWSDLILGQKIRSAAERVGLSPEPTGIPDDLANELAPDTMPPTRLRILRNTGVTLGVTYGSLSVAGARLTSRDHDFLAGTVAYPIGEVLKVTLHRVGSRKSDIASSR